MRPSDLSRLRMVGDPQVHPDGERIAFVVSRPDLDADRYERRIHVWTPTDGHRAFTHGPADTNPRWSPAGDRLAFLRAGGEPGDHAQLAVMSAAGGEARVLTDLPLGVTDLTWSPDGTRLAVVGVEWTADLADLDDDERARRPRRITRLPYRTDPDGWTHHRRQHIWLVDTEPDPTTTPRCLTPGDDDEREPVFRADGRAVVFVSARGPDRETSPAVEVYEVDVDGGEPRQLVGSGLWRRPVARADGTLVLHGLPDPLDWPAPLGLFSLAADGTTARLDTELDRDIDAPAGAVVTDDGVLALVEDRGRVHAYRFDGDGGHVRVVDGDRVVTGLSATRDGATVAFTATATTDPGELWRVVDGRTEVLTDLNADLRDHGDLVDTEHVVFEREGVDIDAWIVRPATADADVPLLLSIHGGPTAQYGFGFFDEFQVYAGAGYAVVGVNPRGSSGRGLHWARAVVGAWTDPASVDVLDLDAAVDMVAARHPEISGERVGVMGGSYGGYATARLLVRSDRFRSAVVERALLNWVSFGGTSDIGPFFDRMFLDRTMPHDAVDLLRASPVVAADRIATPTLIIHAEQDWRCPIEQAEQLFAVLRRNGVDAELLRVPGENHELSRSGSPRHRVERFEAILDWHDRHLAAARSDGGP